MRNVQNSERKNAVDDTLLDFALLCLRWWSQCILGWETMKSTRRVLILLNRWLVCSFVRLHRSSIRCAYSFARSLAHSVAPDLIWQTHIHCAMRCIDSKNEELMFPSVKHKIHACSLRDGQKEMFFVQYLEDFPFNMLEILEMRERVQKMIYLPVFNPSFPPWCWWRIKEKFGAIASEQTSKTNNWWSQEQLTTRELRSWKTHF